MAEMNRCVSRIIMNDDEQVHQLKDKMSKRDFLKNPAISCLQRMYIFIFYFIFIEVKLIYSVVLISAAQRSQLYTHTLFFIMVCYKDTESRSLCSTVRTEDLAVYPCYV